ncbi:MAG: TVP38/TMEM64 family protein [Candidatus Bipolaricaulia bacterium]
MNKRLLLAGLGWSLLLGVVLLLALRWGPGLWELLRDEAQLKKTISEIGPLGPLIFIGLQFLQVVVFVIPGEVVQVAGGYIYGPWLGLIYSLIGIGLGSAAAFFIARALGRPFVEAFIRRETIKKLDGALTRGGGLAALFLLFLLPGVPKDALCYVSGLSAIPFLLFFLISIIGRLPALIISVIFGSNLASRQWEVVVAIAAATLVLLLLGYIFRARLQGWQERLLARFRRGPGDLD